TFDSNELRRWPLKWSSRDGRERVAIGPPEHLINIASPEPKGHLAFCGPNTNRVATAEVLLGVNVVELAPTPPIVQSWRTPTASFVAASPDGRWVATGSYGGPGFQVWDTLRNAQARLWQTGDADVAFSPDGRWLVTGSGGSAYAGAECV